MAGVALRSVVAIKSAISAGTDRPRLLPLRGLKGDVAVTASPRL